MDGETVVVRRGEHGWQAGDADRRPDQPMVLADLLAAGLSSAGSARWRWSLALAAGVCACWSLQVIIHMLWITMG
jgi:hypothetical protein